MGTNTKIKMSVSELNVSSKKEAGFITDFVEMELDITNEGELRKVFKNKVHSTNVWKDGHCKNSNYIGMYGIAIDVDSGLTIELARRRFAHLVYIIYTSTNHTKEHNKFRIIFPFDPNKSVNPLFSRKSEGELALSHAKYMVIESDESTFKLATKFFPSCGVDEDFELYVNYDETKLWLEITEDNLKSAEKRTTKSGKTKLTLKNTQGVWKRPSPLNNEDYFVLGDKSIKLSLSQVRSKLSGSKKFVVYCPRCDDIDTESISGTVQLNNGVVSLYCSHCHSEGNGIGGKGVYMEAKSPVDENVYLYKNLDNSRKPYWIEKNKDGFWSADPTDPRKVWEAGFNPDELPFFENFSLDTNEPDGEMEISSRGCVVFNAAVKSKYRPAIKPIRNIKARDGLDLWKKRAPVTYAVLHNIVGEEKVEVWMMNWFGKLLDHKQNVCVPVLAGNGRIGKSYFFEDIIGSILGKPFVFSSKGDQIADRFCETKAVTAWLYVANEVKITQENEAYVKALISNPGLEVERKCVDSYTTTNHRSYVFTTNRGDAVKMSVDERRFIVCYPPDGGISIYDLMKSLGHTLESLNDAEERELYVLAELFESIDYDEKELTVPSLTTEAKKMMAGATDNSVGRLYRFLKGEDPETEGELISEICRPRFHKEYDEVLQEMFRVIYQGDETIGDGIDTSNVEEYVGIIVRGFLMNRAFPIMLKEALERVIGTKMSIMKAQAKDDLQLQSRMEFGKRIRLFGKYYRCISVI